MKYSSKFKLILRLAVAVPFLAILLIVGVFAAFRGWIQFLKYGGETNVYQKDDTVMLRDVFEELKSQRSV